MSIEYIKALKEQLDHHIEFYDKVVEAIRSTSNDLQAVDKIEEAIEEFENR